MPTLEFVNDSLILDITDKNSPPNFKLPYPTSTGTITVTGEFVTTQSGQSIEYALAQAKKRAFIKLFDYCQEHPDTTLEFASFSSSHTRVDKNRKNQVVCQIMAFIRPSA